jgi:hypothetical protein
VLYTALFWQVYEGGLDRMEGMGISRTDSDLRDAYYGSTQYPNHKLMVLCTK